MGGPDIRARPPVESWRQRVRWWFGRYAPAEVAATFGALLAGGAANLAGSTAATVYAATFGEFVAFYGVIIWRDLIRRDLARQDLARQDLARRDLSGGRAREGRPWWRFAALLLEFGPAELLDALIVRPLAMYLAATMVGNLLLGIVIGKVAADVVFYAVAIAGHELGRTSDRQEVQHVRSRQGAPETGE
jgi:hypothetical protein